MVDRDDAESYGKISDRKRMKGSGLPTPLSPFFFSSADFCTIPAVFLFFWCKTVFLEQVPTTVPLRVRAVHHGKVVQNLPSPRCDRFVYTCAHFIPDAGAKFKASFWTNG